MAFVIVIYWLKMNFKNIEICNMLTTVSYNDGLVKGKKRRYVYIKQYLYVSGQTEHWASNHMLTYWHSSCDTVLYYIEILLY